MPPWETACTGNGEEALAIVYPTNNARLYLPRSITGELQGLTLRASHRDRDRRIFWYLDQEIVGQTERHHSLSIFLEPGDHVLTVVDSEGDRDKVRFRVEGLLESQN